MPKICKACSNSVFGGGYCKNHQYLRTDKKPPKPKASKPIKYISRKKAAEDKIYLTKRKSFLLSHPLCTANLSGCSKIATDIHHTKGRGIYTLREDTWLPVCRNCHQWIELHPEEAKQLNFSQSRI